MSQHTTAQLAELIDKRRACLVQLRSVGEKQAELIAGGDMGALLRLLSAKNQLIAVLQTIEQQLAPFHDQNPDEREWPSEASRQQCADTAAECRQLLEQVMQLERDNQRKMTHRRDDVAQQLETVTSAARARTAYRAQTVAVPTRIANEQPNPGNPSTQLDLDASA